MEKEIITRIQIDVGFGSSSLTVDKEEATAFLLDTGTHTYYKKVIETIENSDIKSITIGLTHWHDDHYGGLNKVIDYCLEHDIVINDLILPKPENGKRKDIQNVLDKIFISSVQKELGKQLYEEHPFSEESFNKMIAFLTENNIDKADHQRMLNNRIKDIASKENLSEEKIQEVFKLKQLEIENIGLKGFLAKEFIECEDYSTREAILSNYKKCCKNLNEEEVYYDFEEKIKSELKKKDYKFGKNHSFLKNVTIVEREDEVHKVKVSNKIEFLYTAPRFNKNQKKNKNLYTENNRSMCYVIKMGDYYHFSAGDIDSNGKKFLEEKFERSEIFNKILSWIKKCREKDAEHHASDGSVRKQNDEKWFPKLETIFVSALNGEKGNHPGPNFIKLTKEMDYNFFLTEKEGDIIEHFYDDGKRYFQTDEMIKVNIKNFIEEAKKTSLKSSVSGIKENFLNKETFKRFIFDENKEQINNNPLLKEKCEIIIKGIE